MFSLSTSWVFKNFLKYFFFWISKRSGQIDKFLDLCLSTSQFSSETISIFHSFKFSVIFDRMYYIYIHNQILKISVLKNYLGKHIFKDFLLHRMTAIEQALDFPRPMSLRYQFFGGWWYPALIITLNRRKTPSWTM